MTEDLKIILDAIHSMDESLNAKIDGVKESLETQIRDLDTKIDSVNESLNAKIDSVNESLNSKIAELDHKIDKVHDELWQAMDELRISMENEVKNAIKVVAEGHLDLARHLTKIEKLYAENEMREVRLLILEQDVRRIKKKLKMTHQ